MAFSLISARFHGAEGFVAGHGERHNIHVDRISCHSLDVIDRLTVFAPEPSSTAEFMTVNQTLTTEDSVVMNNLAVDLTVARIVGITDAPANEIVTTTATGFLGPRSLAVAMAGGVTDHVAIPTGVATNIAAPVSGAWIDTGLLLFNADGLFGTGTGRITFDLVGKYNISGLIEWTGSNVTINPTSGNARRNNGFRKLALIQDPSGAATEILCICSDQSNPGVTFPFFQNLDVSIEVTSLAGGANVFILQAEQDSTSTQDVRVTRLQTNKFL